MWTLIRSISSLAAVGGYDSRSVGRAGVAAERDQQSDSVQREHRGELPAIAATAGMTNSATGRSDPVDRLELLAGHLQPCGGGDAPAPQLGGVELVGVREHPP